MENTHLTYVKHTLSVHFRISPVHTSEVRCLTHTSVMRFHVYDAAFVHKSLTHIYLKVLKHVREGVGIGKRLHAVLQFAADWRSHVGAA